MPQQTLKSEPILQTENNHGDCLLEEKKKTGYYEILKWWIDGPIKNTTKRYVLARRMSRSPYISPHGIWQTNELHSSNHVHICTWQKMPNSLMANMNHKPNSYRVEEHCSEDKVIAALSTRRKLTSRRSTPSGPKAGTARAKFWGCHCGYTCQSRRALTPGHCLSVGVPSSLHIYSNTSK